MEKWVKTRKRSVSNDLFFISREMTIFAFFTVKMALIWLFLHKNSQFIKKMVSFHAGYKMPFFIQNTKKILALV